MQVTWQTADPKFISQSKRHAPGMVISRKDTIIIAVLINIALLAILFATANKQDTAIAEHVVYDVQSVVSNEVVYEQSEIAKVIVQEEQNVFPVDEIDQILQKYLERQEKEEKKKQKATQKTSTTRVVKKAEEQMQIVVKEGDMLSKLAKKYGVTVAGIIVANQLESDALSVGQTLFIPKNQQAVPKKKAAVIQKRQTVSKKVSSPLYYAVKKGDSPWTIARKFDIKLEKFLQINGLTSEGQARSLKVGQKIRIR